MKRWLLACGLAALGLAAAYTLLGAIAAIMGSWSGETAIDQAAGLAIHAAIVFVRGLLPSVLTTLALRGLAERRLGRPPGWALTGTLATLAAAAAVPVFLISQLGSWPHLQIGSAVDAAATVALLALGSAAAVLWATRLTSASRRP